MSQPILGHGSLGQGLIRTSSWALPLVLECILHLHVALLCLSEPCRRHRVGHLPPSLLGPCCLAGISEDCYHSPLAEATCECREGLIRLAMYGPFPGSTAKAVFGCGDTGWLPPFLQHRAQVGKTGSLLFSLILESLDRAENIAPDSACCHLLDIRLIPGRHWRRLCQFAQSNLSCGFLIYSREPDPGRKERGSPR